MQNVFREECLVSVILYRTQWGKSPWTRIEETAIKEGCLERGWDGLFILRLDSEERPPIWVPRTHVCYNFGDYGLSQVAGALKSRVQELGGSVAPVTPLSNARLAQSEARRIKLRDEVFRSVEWIRTTARPAIALLMAEIVRLANEIVEETEISLRSSCTDHSCGLTDDRISVTIFWQQEYSNVMGRLLLCEYTEGIVLPGEQKVYMMGYPPNPMTTTIILPDLSATGELIWFFDEAPSIRLNAKDIVDKALNKFICLFQRANQGELDLTPAFLKLLRAQHPPDRD